MRAADPVSGICEAVMRAFHEAARHATTTSPLGRAKATLGERYFEAAAEAMRRHLLRVVVTEAAQRRSELAACGPVAAQAAIADIVASAIHDVVTEAERTLVVAA